MCVYTFIDIFTSRPRIFKNEDVLFNSYKLIRSNKDVLGLSTS